MHFQITKIDHMKGKQVLLLAFSWLGPVLLITAMIQYLFLPEREGLGFFYIACAYNGLVVLVGCLRLLRNYQRRRIMVWEDVLSH